MIEIKNIKLNILKNISNKGFFHLLSANLLIQIVAFASQLFVAGILIPDDIGRIKIIQTYLSIFSIVAGMGFNASTLKLCSENRTDNELRNIFRSGFYFTIISTVSLYFIVLIANYFLIFSTDKIIHWLIPLGLFPIISNSLFLVFTSYFQAAKKIKLLSKLTITNKLLSIIGIIIFTYFFGIQGYYYAYNLSYLLILVVCFKAYGSIFSGTSKISDHQQNISMHWQYARPSMFSNLLSEISAYVDILLISFFIKDMQQIGFYSFALTLTVIFRIFPNTVQQITIPYFSSLANKKSEFIIAFKKYNLILYAAIALTLIAAIVLIPVFVDYFFNGKYEKSMLFFPFLATGWSLRQLVQLQNGAIFGLGKMRYNVYISLISLLFNIFTISIALYYFGLMGAAYASIPCGLIHVLASRYYYKKAESEM